MKRNNLRIVLVSVIVLIGIIWLLQLYNGKKADSIADIENSVLTADASVPVGLFFFSCKPDSSFKIILTTLNKDLISTYSGVYHKHADTLYFDYEGMVLKSCQRAFMINKYLIFKGDSIDFKTVIRKNNL